LAAGGEEKDPSKKTIKAHGHPKPEETVLTKTPGHLFEEWRTLKKDQEGMNNEQLAQQERIGNI
jgi:hypothetical protein